ncbi:Putative uncharacterized protein [Taphrina deformans PYCC 5710]|uniref:Ras GTPase activating protein n=1 Tax=Taphrina deformans (strain PYCC 5710 / ATCC 11124 / CBS 356.35 / IMI 108563 / JCM 9778 / NBRC 8474) TaxID=1097556 RepID=R4X9D4_TAPDE|nr:Putative uncharacterized protein [Taphrina deformans PYCC 5710]|eukprot:CCG82346.1 Putative uncharacterized protein [Taphrina deformans PYCC 5710]
MNSKRSSVHMRTLSRLGVNLEADVQNLDVPLAMIGDSETQDVTGLSGRLRLQKVPAVKSTSIGTGNWMDRQRQHIQAYEYLCHIGEAKEWIEGCLGEQIPAIVDLEEQLRNGIVLARLAQAFVPGLVPRIFDAPRLQFRHSDNINRFFQFVDRVEVPDNFRFELTDLYEKKNIPKVIYCIHALSFVLVNAGLASRIGNLVGKLEFTEDELRKTQKSLDATGVTMPNFKSVGDAIAGGLETPVQAAESEEERQHKALEQHEEHIIAMQAQARGFLFRQEICTELSRLETLEARIIAMQSSARGYLVRQQYYLNAHTYKDINNWVLSLQAVCRGYTARYRTDFRNISLSVNTAWTVKIQALCRGRLQRLEHRASVLAIENACEHNTIVSLQSLLRGHVQRRSLANGRATFAEQDSFIVTCQATIKGFVQRRTIVETKAQLRGELENIRLLQTCCRNKLYRMAYQQILRRLGTERASFIKICAISSGFLMRKKLDLFGNLLLNEEDLVVDVQALCQATLRRLDYNRKLIYLARSEHNIINLQAAATAAVQRRRFQERQNHYRENMARVIKVQSFVRARQQGAAYRSLTIDRDPPVSTIKNFIHLLNDSNFDFEEEIAMERGRKDVIQSIRQNEAAEEHIEQMDVKIALLVKQAIKIDEVIQHQRHMDKGLGSLHQEANPFDLKAMNKKARSQLENYQRFFYILQTQPVYLARLFSALCTISSTEKETKRLESLTMIMFGYAQKKREEYFLLKLIRSSVIKNVSDTNGVEEFLQGQYFWSRLLSSYLRGTKKHKFLHEIFGPIVTSILQDDFLDLESNPLLIYRMIRQDEELRTGQQSLRPVNVTQEYAIQDPDTRVMFIKHLRDLRDLTTRTIDTLERDLQKFPWCIRYVARELYRAMQEHIEPITPHELYRLVGHLICRQFITPTLVSLDQYGIAEEGVRPAGRRNLAELSKILNQIASGRVFEDGSYLQPLNEFIEKSIDRMSTIFRALLEVEDLETHFAITELDDVVATKRPILYIKVSDIFALHSMVATHLHDIAPEVEDPLNYVLLQLGPPPSRAEDMMIMSISNSELALTLDPKAIDVDDPEADERALFIQAKRNLLYIIRVQSGSNLMDILVEPVTEGDERKWREIVLDEQGQLESRTIPTSNGSLTQDVSTLSYPVLKRRCLENIVELERLGWITRENNYQELLNSIADDIRTQNRRRIERQYELHATRETLKDLDEKRDYLNGQLKSYNDYIEQAMMSLQSKKSKKKSILPFTKQYFHVRDLQKAGRMPKFGSRKYGASKLYDKGVLISIRGEQPPFEKFNITISSDRIGEFVLQSTVQGASNPGTSASIQLDELLQAQYNKSETIDVFEGGMTLRVSLMLNLVFKHFFSQ